MRQNLHRQAVPECLGDGGAAVHAPVVDHQNARQMHPFLRQPFKARKQRFQGPRFVIHRQHDVDLGIRPGVHIQLGWGPLEAFSSAGGVMANPG